MDTIKTKSTSDKTMDVKPFIIRQNSTTRLLFYPRWVSVSEHPLRGGFRFDRKSPNDTWVQYDSKKLSTLHKDETYILNLDGEDIANLFSNIESIKETLAEYGHSYQTKSYILSDKNVKGIFLQIGDVANKELVVKELKTLEKNKFENLGTVVARAKLERVIEEFEKNLNNSKESFWQNFFEDNAWIFQQLFAYPLIYLNGETYLGGRNSYGRQGKGGLATDFLLKNNSWGSFAVVEIKTPMTNLVGGLYRGEVGSGNNESYSMSSDLTGSLVQIENQVYTAVSNFKNILGDDFDNLNAINPQGIIIIGKYKGLSEQKKVSFDLFRKAVGIKQIITFDELLDKLHLMKEIYTRS